MNVAVRVRRVRAGVGILLLPLAIVATLVPERAAANGVTHHITLVNKCKQPIWLAELGAPEVDPPSWALAPACNTTNAARLCPSGSCADGACTCQSDADCTFDQTVSPAPTCDTGTGRCVKSTTVNVDATWSGRFWGRTGCTGSGGTFSCETGNCDGAGNLDCTVSADGVTLFELTGAGFSGSDVFDVSLVSGYNLPISAKVVPSSTLPGWQPNTAYAQSAQIVEQIGNAVFLFQNTQLPGTSGSVKPSFPDVLFGQVADGSDITWTNVNAVCEPSGCKSGGIREHECPPLLRITSGGKYVGCDAPANACTTGSGCEADLDYYQCQVNEGAQDQFGNVLTLQSANGASYACFSAADCPPGTTCEIRPEFESGYQMTKHAGLCTPIPQNGGCGPGDDGKPCPAIGYPFVDYQCQTLKNVTENQYACVPPRTRGHGELWWNADNWTQDPMPAACTQDADCTAAQKCLAPPAAVNGGLKQCPTDGDCTCWDAKTCASSSECAPGKCLDSTGLENAACATTETCYCAPQGIYSGTCGASNPKWQKAGRKISVAGARWPHTVKQRCPRAYSFQFDDPSSSWSCPNPANGLTDYRVVFCGNVD